MAYKEPPEGHIDIPTAAKMAGVCIMTMRRMVIDEGRIPYESRPAGSRTYYYLKKQDVEKYLAAYRPRHRGRPKKQQHSEYEIIMISCGKIDVLYKTNSVRDLSATYSRMIEYGHKLVRLRVDGRILTIHESDKIGYSCSPRFRKTTA